MLWFCAAFLMVMSIPAESAPVQEEMVDMTYALNEDTLFHPSQVGYAMEITKDEITPQGFRLKLEKISTGTHVGTHMDSPRHIGNGSWTVDQIPLSHLFAPAAVIDITEKAKKNPDALVEVADLENWEKTYGDTLDEKMVLFLSGWGRRWSDRKTYLGTSDNDTSKFHFPGISENASRWIVEERNVYGVGTEAVSLDHGPSKDFIAHRILLAGDVYGLENVANMDKIPKSGATLSVMPLKIGDGMGAHVRIIARFPKSGESANHSIPLENNQGRNSSMVL